MSTLEKTYYLVRLNGRLGTSYAAPSLAEAMEEANPQATDHIAWGIVKAKSVSVARMLDPDRWFTGVISLSAVTDEIEKGIGK